MDQLLMNQDKWDTMNNGPYNEKNPYNGAQHSRLVRYTQGMGQISGPD
jgi:hypothetical protein